MDCRIVLIGGGSYNWTPTLAKDLFLREGLKGGELILVDIKPEAASLLEAYCKPLAERIRTGWTVRVAGLDEALDGAFAVCASISTGDLAAMDKDYHIPEEFGVYHTVSDTVGPGGISRSLRNIPVFVDFARRMEKRCPDAWLVHVTNPLTQITRAVCKASSIQAVGLCHNYAGTAAFLADFLAVAYEDIHAVSVGINHGTWLKDITVADRPIDAGRLTLSNYLEYEAGKRGAAVTIGTLDDQIEAMFDEDESLPYYLAFELYELFGYWPIGSAPHIAENWPFYLNDPATIRKHRIRRKGVLPGREEGRERNRKRIVDIVEGREDFGELRPSREGLSTIVESLYTGAESRAMVAMPNTGQITNLPEGVVVETWGTVGKGGVSPCDSGAVPDGLLGYVQLLIDEQELTVEAALSGDRDKVVRAMHISPLLQNKDAAAELTDRLLAATRQWLPQF